MTKPFQVALRSVAALLLLGIAVAVSFYRNPIWFADESVRFHLRRQHVASRYSTVDGYRIHYLEAGPAAGEPLLLIHGLGAKAEDWSPLIPTYAAQGFHVYAPDLLGYGRSAKPDVDYSIRLQEQMVADFMQTVGITHADVGGWSMGGWVALKLTVDHPALVDRLIAFDAAGIYFPATFTAALFTPTDAVGLQQLILKLTPRSMHLPPFVQRAAIRKLQANAWVIDRSVDAMTSGRDLLDFELGSIHKPTLIVWGAEDNLIPLSVGQKMTSDIPGAKLFPVPGCGHLAPAECSEPVLKATVDFLHAAD